MNIFSLTLFTLTLLAIDSLIKCQDAIVAAGLAMSSDQTNMQATEATLETQTPDQAPRVTSEPVDTVITTGSNVGNPNIKVVDQGPVWHYGQTGELITVQRPLHSLPPTSNVYVAPVQHHVHHGSHGHLHQHHPQTRGRQYKTYAGQWFPTKALAEQQRDFTNSACQGTNKRNIEDKKNFELWFLNETNHDIMFSVCESHLPGHRIILESSSQKFSEWLMNKVNHGEKEPAVLESSHDFNELFADPQMNKQCPDESLISAFKTFLQYFYAGAKSFDSLQDLDVALMVWKLVKTYLGDQTAEYYIEPKIIQLMSLRSLNKVYRFIRDNRIDSLKAKWSKYIADNSALIGESLPFSCGEVNDDVELFDQFLQSLNVSQSQVIHYIRHYLQNCPESIRQVIQDASSLPNSLYFFRCTIQDLKQLVDIGFISYKILAEELENRLLAKERICQELKKNSAYNLSNVYHHLRQMEPYLGVIRRA